MALPSAVARRWKVCFGMAICHILCGCLILFLSVTLVVFSANNVKLTDNPSCQEFVGSTVVHGVYHIVAGAFGVAGYRPASRRTPTLLARGDRAAVFVYVLLCVLVAWPLALNSHTTFCFRHIEWFDDDKALIYSVFILKFIATYFGHLLGAIGAGLALPDVCLSAWNTHLSMNTSDKRISVENKSSLSKPALQLPEARTHVQEAPGTGEKVTVVSLPYAEGVVYAVPEDQYVIRRGEFTYAAPTGNPRLAAFFPTYTRVQVD